jgi:hypothetical protein
MGMSLMSTRRPPSGCQENRFSVIPNDDAHRRIEKAPNAAQQTGSATTTTTGDWGQFRKKSRVGDGNLGVRGGVEFFGTGIVKCVEWICGLRSEKKFIKLEEEVVNWWWWW